MDDEKRKELKNILKELQNLHYPCGPTYTKSQKAAALLHLQENELEAIYSLVEAHVPALRFSAVHRYEKAVESGGDIIPLNKNHLNFGCSTVNMNDKIKHMLDQLAEMPEEWVIVQLTSQYNIKESLEVNHEKLHTSALHLTVFNCGKNSVLPFTVTVDPPKDPVNGNVIEVRQEMNSILADNVHMLENFKAFAGKAFSLQTQKEIYNESRYTLNNRLQSLVKQIQDKWLGEWRCLLIGKFVENEIERTIVAYMEEILKNERRTITDRNKSLLRHIFKAGDVLSLKELKKALHYIFPKDEDKAICSSLFKAIQSVSVKHQFAQQSRHSIILIVDEKLDFLPWEMMDVLQDHPVSRMPSLHFTYALFKEHESNIVEGLRVNVSSKKGTYLINPGLDLKNMETRLCSFFNYWIPNWSGLIGITPSEDDFRNMLANSDIFIYSGHGNGTQFLPSEKIQKMRLNTVVLLFGCSSVKLLSLGPQVEMYGSYQTYLTACSPCIVGTLWPVTDIETDVVTTEFLSQWIPSTAAKHWKLIDRKLWEMDGTVQFGKKVISKCEKHEPDLLRALCRARKAARQYLMKAAYVARGLPVRIK